MFAVPYREIQGKMFHLLFLEAKIQLSPNELMTLLVDRGWLPMLFTCKNKSVQGVHWMVDKKQRALPMCKKLLEQHLHFFTKIYLFCSQIANNAHHEKLDEQLRQKKWSNLTPVASADRTEDRGFQFRPFCEALLDFLRSVSAKPQLSYHWRLARV